MSRLKTTLLSQFLASFLALSGCTGDSGIVASEDDGFAAGDNSPPAKVTDVGVSYPIAGGDAVVTWTAPSDNGATVDHYQIRYSYSFPLDWDLAGKIDSVPAPLAPGEIQTARISNPRRGHDLFVAVRSVDGAGNTSATSEVGTAHITGYRLALRCIDAVTGIPQPSLRVTVTGRLLQERMTDVDGNVALDDVADGAGSITVRSVAGIVYHTVTDVFTVEADRAVTYHMIPYEPVAGDVLASVLEVFRAAAVTNQKPVLKKWRDYPVPIYIPEFVNDRNIDYASTARSAVAEWEMVTGRDIFEEVASPPASGVVVSYPSRSQMGTNIGITEHENDPEGYPSEDRIKIVNDYQFEDKLYTTMMHELGHAIRLAHLPAGYLMYAGQPLPGGPIEAEVKATVLYLSLPNGLDTRIYDASVPDQQAQKDLPCVACD